MISVGHVMILMKFKTYEQQWKHIYIYEYIKTARENFYALHTCVSAEMYLKKKKQHIHGEFRYEFRNARRRIFQWIRFFFFDVVGPAVHHPPRMFRLNYRFLCSSECKKPFACQFFFFSFPKNRTFPRILDWLFRLWAYWFYSGVYGYFFRSNRKPSRVFFFDFLCRFLNNGEKKQENIYAVIFDFYF